MALNGNDLGDAVANAIIALDPDMTADQKAQLMTAWESIGTAMVAYLTANAAITPGTFSNSGGPVTGTGNLT